MYRRWLWVAHSYRRRGGRGGIRRYSHSSTKFDVDQATKLLTSLVKENSVVLKEHEALRVIGTFGIGVLQHYVFNPTDSLAGLPEKVPAVSVIKGILRHKDGSLITHKTEYKAIELNIPRKDVVSVTEKFIQRFQNTDILLEGLMFRQYVDYTPTLGNEILISGYQDAVFGPCVVLTFGGVLAETYKKELNIQPFVIPVCYDLESFFPAIRGTLIVKMVLGEARGCKKLVEWEVLEGMLRSFAAAMKHFSSYNPTAPFIIKEAEINPATIEKGQIIALDSVMTVELRRPDSPVLSVRSTKPLHKIASLLQPRSVALVGCSEKIDQATFAEAWARKLFRTFALTKAAERLFDRVLLKTMFAEPKEKPKKSNSAKQESLPSSSSEKKEPSGILKFLKKVIIAQQFNPCNFILEHSIKAGLDVYPVHPRATELLGRKCVKNVSELKAANHGKPVDVMVVGIPAVDSVKVMKTAFKEHLCESVQLFSAGFAETEAGRHLQDEIMNALRALESDPARRTLINGPNTVGNWVSGPEAFNTIFADNPKTHITPATSTMPPVALFCQSGGFSVARLSSLAPMLNVCMCISVGNQMDLGVCDFLENLLDHGPPRGTPMPVAIGLYIEGLSTEGDGVRLMHLVARARREKGMTVVVYKAGRTEQGQQAVATHTASMASDYTMFANLLESAGAVMSPTLEQFNTLLATAGIFGIHMKQVIQATTKPPFTGIMAVTNSGYLKCGMADAIPKPDPLLKSKIILSPLLDHTKMEVERIFAAHRLTNVVEVNEILDITPAMHVQGWKDLVTVLLKDPTPSVYIFAPVITPSMLPNPFAVKSVFNAFRQRYPNRPFMLGIEGGSRYNALRSACWNVGIPTFECADDAMRTATTLLKAWLRD